MKLVNGNSSKVTSFQETFPFCDLYASIFTHIHQLAVYFEELKRQLQVQQDQMKSNRDQMRVIMQQMTELQISHAKATKKLEQQVWVTFDPLFPSPSLNAK